MKVIKKINNNVVLCEDGNGNELVAFGKGIGFNGMPCDLELQKIERTFYNVNDHYMKLLNELPETVFEVSISIVEKAKKTFDRAVAPNVVFSLADHISFAIERIQNGINVQMTFAYDIEHLYTKEMQVALYAVKVIQKYLKVRLPKSEVIGIALHFINNAAQEINTKRAGEQEIDTDQVIENMTDIIEQELNFVVNKSGYSYYRFCCHCRYFIKRIGAKKQYHEQESSMFQFFRKDYPDIHRCAIEVKQYLLDIFNIKCSNEELLYLMLHIKRLYSSEDCNL